MHIDPSKWFGLALLAGLFFLWSLLSLIEAEASTAGWIWGIVVFGAITLIAAAMALVTFMGQGRTLNSDDLLTRADHSAPPRAGHGRPFESSGPAPRGAGELPRRSAGRDIR